MSNDGDQSESPEPTTFGLRPPRNRVDPRCRAWWRCQVAVLTAIIALPLAIVGLIFPVIRWWFLTPAIAAVLIGIPALVLVPLVRWRIHRWETTDLAVYSRSGLFWQEWRAAPLSRVQTVDLDRGPLQRPFGLATISVSTASSRGAVRIAALDHDLATRTVDLLTELTEADEQDAT